MFPRLVECAGQAKIQVAITVLARMPDDPEARRTLNSPEGACCSIWTTAPIDSSNLPFNLSWCSLEAYMSTGMPSAVQFASLMIQMLAAICQVRHVHTREDSVQS